MRDLVLLIVAVGAGILLYDHLAVPIALLGLALVPWTGVAAGTSALVVSSVAQVVAAFVLGALLVLATIPFAHKPRRLALFLAIALPVVLILGLTVSMYDTASHSLTEAVGFAIRTFAVVGLAFAAGCLLTAWLFPRPRPRSQ